ncbi:cytochrome P450 [Auricularia subglabra TFB-10046 SS5]|nr:cytochrome P450 [Auricularia subglabra TFB-10046 SS5]
MISPVVALALALVLVLIVKRLWGLQLRRKSSTSWPPGPPGLPIIGNLLQVPSTDSHLSHFELARKYGPIFRLKLFQRNVIVLSDLKIAIELLDKRGAIYSNRPKFYMSEMAGWEWDAANMMHGDEWRARRRLVHLKFYGNTISHLHGLIRRTTIEFASNLLKTPDDFEHHIRRSAAANIVGAAYGIRVAEDNDPYIAIGVQAVESLGTQLLPGSNAIDEFPILRFIPPWVPVLGYWSKAALELRKYPTAMRESKGIAQPCMMTDNLASLEPGSEVTEEIIKDACGVAYLGGADTTVCTILFFLMAMVLWPEYQRKAQQELDRVVGDRLPEFADCDSLPYLEAIIREIYRRYPVTPMALAHAVEQDDHYDGFYIPKGTIVLANVWAMMHDGDVYQDPFTFNPDRWMRDGKLDETAQDPRKATFGFGRRICPGRHFADSSVFLTIATMLKCFDIGTYIEDGVELPPSGEIISGVLSCPAPFKCTIKPRSPEARSLVEAARATLD